MRAELGRAIRSSVGARAAEVDRMQWKARGSAKYVSPAHLSRRTHRQARSRANTHVQSTEARYRGVIYEAPGRAAALGWGIMLSDAWAATVQANRGVTEILLGDVVISRYTRLMAGRVSAARGGGGSSMVAAASSLSLSHARARARLWRALRLISIKWTARIHSPTFARERKFGCNRAGYK